MVFFQRSFLFVSSEMSQITVMCLHAKRFVLFIIVFIKQIFFTLLNRSFFYCTLIAANVRDFKVNCTAARE